MRLGEQDRRVLFASHLPSQQLQRYLFKRPGHSAAVEEVKEVFSDLSRGAFTSLLYSAKARGYIRIEGNEILLDVDKSDIRTTIREVVWKDIRIQKVFTLAQIVDDTGLAYDEVRGAVQDFCRDGLVSRSKRIVSKPTVYTLIVDSPVRPIMRKKENAADRAFSIASSYGSRPFTRAALQQDLETAGFPVTTTYANVLIAQWCKAGMIRRSCSSNDRTPHYIWCAEERAKRPMVYRMEKEG